MIKINLLPSYILERRRVKTLVMWLAVLLIVEVLGFAAYVWAPAPFSLSQRQAEAEDRHDRALQAAVAVEAIADETKQIEASYQAKENFVEWVADADSRPAKWVDYFEEINKYIPADVVINGLQPPSGNVLTLNGQTSDVMAAVRFYLNMLRCELISPDPDAVVINTNRGGWPDQVQTGANPKMQHAVTLQVSLRPEVLTFMGPVATPAAVGGTAGAGPRARMGAGPSAGIGAGSAMGGPRGRGGPRGMGGGRRGPRGPGAR